MESDDPPSKPVPAPRWYLKEHEPDAGRGWQVAAFLALLILASVATSLVFGFYPYFASAWRYADETTSHFEARRYAATHEAPSAFRNRLLAGLVTGAAGAAATWFIMRARIREEGQQDHR